MAEYIPWWKKQADFREKKAVVKLYREDKSFLTSVHIPSVYWPLNGPYEVFHWDNTCALIEEPKIEALFDAQEYRIGKCYQNTNRLAKAFRAAGYNIKTYCGWAFIDDTTPIHHCWAVLTDEDNHKAVLDLSCDNYRMRLWFSELEAKDPSWYTTGNVKEKFVEWVAYALKELTHSQRCYPLGLLPPTHLYIGSECDPQEGIALYRKLIAQNPGHLCERNINAAGYNRTQWMLKQQGLMD